MNEKIFNSNFIRICFASIFLQSGNQIVMAVLPLFMKYMGSDPSVLGIATSLSAFAAMSSRPVAGYLADKKSRKLVMILGICILLLGMLGLSVLPFTAAIIIIRFIQGFGISTATTAQMAIATDVLPAAKVKKGLSYFGICGTIASAFGPALGLMLIYQNNYLPSWLGSAAILTVSLIIVSTFTYEKSFSRETKPAKNGSEIKWLWRYFEKDAIPTSLIQLVLMIANSGVIVFLPTYAAEIGIQNIGVFYILQAIMMFTANIAVGNLIHRIRNPLYLLLPATLCFGGSLLALFLATETTLILIAAVLYGIGLGVCITTISTITMSSAAPDRRGAASATFQCAIDIGFCIGSLTWGFVAGLLGYRSLYGFLGLLPVVAALMAIFIFGLKRDGRNREFA